MSPYETDRFASIPRDELREVTSPDDLVQVISRMLADFQAHPGEWENHTPEEQCLKPVDGSWEGYPPELSR